MPVEVTVRHTKVSDVVRNYTEAKAEYVIEDFPKVENVHVILDAQKQTKKAEVVVQGKGSLHIEAEAQSENLRTAIDDAFDKAEKQLRKVRSRVTDHKVAMKQTRRRAAV